MVHQPVIFIVDHNRDIQQFFSGILEKEHYSIRQFHSAGELIPCARKTHPEIILLNPNIPEINGYTVCSQLKTDTLTCDIPVIFLLDQEEMKAKTKVYSAGGSDIIRKPFIEIEIKIKIDMHVKYCRMNREQKAIKEKILMRIQGYTSMGELLSALAHEIRQPLHSMKMITEGIIYWERQKPLKDEKSEKILINLEKVILGIDRINNVIESIYRSINVAKKINIKQVNFNTVIREVLDLFQHKIKYHRIELTMDLDPHVYDFQCTRFQAEQIIIALLSNAIKALDRVNKNKKQIFIRTKEMQDHFTFEIEDNGPGIDDIAREYIFKPFYTKDQETGSPGTGLIIVHTILESINSSIDVINNPDGGAIFRIRFLRRQ